MSDDWKREFKAACKADNGDKVERMVAEGRIDLDATNFPGRGSVSQLLLVLFGLLKAVDHGEAGCLGC